MKVAVISPTPTHPTTSGNRARIKVLIEWLSANGCEVHFIHIGMNTGDCSAMRAAWGDRYHSIPYEVPPWTRGTWRRVKRFAARQLNRPSWYSFGIDDWYDFDVNPKLRNLHTERDFDAVLVEYVFMSRALECFGDGVLKIIDTHDVMTDRYKQFAGTGRFPEWYSTTAQQESKGLHRADVVLAIQDGEKATLGDLTRRRVVSFGHLVSTERVYTGSAERLGSSKTILFVGSGNAMNVAGIQWFLHSVLPKVRDRVPGARLLLAGAICDELAEGDFGVEKLGRLEDLNLAYRQADVVVNPVRQGTGLNIKSIEALGRGMPMVSTNAGARGLEGGAGSAFLVEDSHCEMARAIERVLLDDEVALALSTAAWRFAKIWNSIQGQELAKLLARVGIKPIDHGQSRPIDSSSFT